ncbi:unnamed protein product [Protopolystoma xenopodis]|uniref:Uncharacterized protein n=1 Tax=Protopolystoma xenopodis TaxID=117903 RepID=A0A448WLU2_9PLAT|nr:unnamed protein product [Protopolystoma xenopodis]
MCCLETVSVGWKVGGGLTDMAVAASFNQLVGASICQSVVTTYVVDVKSCLPFTSSSPVHPSSPAKTNVSFPSTDNFVAATNASIPLVSTCTPSVTTSAASSIAQTDQPSQTEMQMMRRESFYAAKQEAMVSPAIQVFDIRLIHSFS